MTRSTKRITMLLGATLAGIIAVSAPVTAFAVEDNSDTKLATSVRGELDLAEAGFSASLVVVSESGAESISVSRSDLSFSTLLNSRGYDTAKFNDDKGNPIQLFRRLKNNEKVVIYSNSVDGTSETIELKLPDVIIEDANLYAGEVIVEDEGVVGSALKTTVIHRDLSKTASIQPESLNAESLSSFVTQIREEVYLTVLSAPVAKSLRVGVKPCGSEYRCKLFKENSLASLKVSGGYVHPLGTATEWTTYSGSRGHEAGAIDFAMNPGTPIYAVTNGTVVESGMLGAGGNMVAIQHDDRRVTGYAHMIETPLVKVGDKVKTGQIIGFVGSTGRSTGPHLHFEVWKDRVWGEVIPSYEYMRLNGIDLGPCIGGPCGLSKMD